VKGIRIERIEAERFGKLEHQTLDLRPGLNVVHGANEAGKSTLLALVRAVLFGFERKRAGAASYAPESGGGFGGGLRLSTPGGSIWVRRSLKRKVEGELAVTAVDGAPLPDSRLADALGGVSKELFYEVFAFGLDELASFERLAQSGVSEALFAAGTQGAQRLPLAFDALRAEAAALFAPKGSKPELNGVLQQLGQVREQLRALGDRPAEYLRARHELEGVAARLESGEAASAVARRERDQLARLVRVLPELARLELVEAELNELPAELTQLAPGAVQRWEGLVSRLEAARTEAAEAQVELSAVVERLSDLEKVLELPEVEVAAALEAYQARCSQRQALGGRRAALDERRRQLEAEVPALGLKPPAAERVMGGDDRDPIGLEGGGIAPVRPAEALLALELGAASRARLSVLRERAGDRQRERAAREAAVRAGQARVSELQAENLRLETELARLPQSSLPVLRRQQSAMARVEPLRTELTRAEERASVPTISRSVIPEPAIGFPLWALVLGWALALLMVLALSTSMPAGSRMRAAVASGAIALAIGAALTALQRRSAKHHAALLAVHREEVARQTEELREAARVRTEAVATAGRLRSELVEALAAAGLKHDEAQSARAEELQSLIDQASHRERLEDQRAATTARLEAAEEEQGETLQALLESERGLESLQAELDQLLAPRGFPPGLSAEAALELWSAAAGLRQRLQELSAEEQSLEAEERDCAQVEEALLTLARQVGIDSASGSAGAARLSALLESARNEREERVRLTDKKSAVTARLSRAERLVLELSAQMSALLANAQCADGDALRLRAAQSARRQEATAELRSLEQLLRSTLGDLVAPPAPDPGSIDECSSTAGAKPSLAVRVRALCAGHGSEDGLRAALATRTGEVEELTRSIKALSEQRGGLRQQISALETDVEVSELRAREEALSARARDLAEHCAEAHLGLLLLQRARARFEDEHQPRVIQLASSLFAELTGGRYTRVFTEPGERELKVRDRAGKPWSAESLSRGTREQLYLAFRLAVIEDFGETRLPLPVILDDTLVNFDPERARLAVQVLARVSRRHQVVSFTCHPSFRDLFRQEGAHALEVASRQLSLLPPPTRSEAG
jgi:uncharacterized protein YhaN